MKHSLQLLGLVLSLSLLAACNGGLKLNCDDDEIELQYAARWGKHRKVKRLLDRGVDIHASCEEHDSAIRNAINGIGIYGGYSECSRATLKLLLDRGADINAKDRFGYTPLMNAARSGLVKTVKLLLDRGASLDVTTKYNDSAITGAFGMGNIDVAKLLLDRRAERPEYFSGLYNDGDRLLWAAFRGDKNKVERILSKGSTSCNSQDISGNTALIWAMLQGDRQIDIVNKLIEHGADLNLQNRRGKTALMYAAEYGHFALASRLIDAGANLNAQDKKGRTALGWARKKNSHNHKAIANTLKKKNAPESGPWKYADKIPGAVKVGATVATLL